MGWESGQLRHQAVFGNLEKSGKHGRKDQGDLEKSVASDFHGGRFREAEIMRINILCSPKGISKSKKRAPKAATAAART